MGYRLGQSTDDAYGPERKTSCGCKPDCKCFCGCHNRKKVEDISIPQDRYILDRYNEFWQHQSLWSQQTFGLDSERGPYGPIKHLEKEVAEVLQEWRQFRNCSVENPQVHIKHMQRELVDCFFLVTDAARRSGLTYTQFMDLVEEKLKINKSRTWGTPVDDEPVEHDRSKD